MITLKANQSIDLSYRIELNLRKNTLINEVDNIDCEIWAISFSYTASLTFNRSTKLDFFKQSRLELYNEFQRLCQIISTHLYRFIT